MTEHRIMLTIYAIVLILIVIGFIKRNNRAIFQFIAMLVSAIVTLCSTVSVFFPKEAATVIFPETELYINENQDLNNKNRELESENNTLVSTNESLANSYTDLRNEYDILEQEYNILKQSQTEVRFADASVVKDGIEVSDTLNKIIILANNKEYYDPRIFSTISVDIPHYDSETERVYFGGNDRISRYEFQNTSEILYNGEVYWKFDKTTEGFLQ